MWCLQSVQSDGDMGGDVTIHCITRGKLVAYAAVEIAALLPRCRSVKVVIVELNTHVKQGALG